MSTLHIIEHISAGYAKRTRDNVSLADLTVAFYTDPNTRGEQLTRNTASGRYVGIDLKTVNALDAARLLYKEAKLLDAKSINIAGNGIYTLARHNWTQKQANDFVYSVLKTVHAYWPLNEVRSGGQTGIDIAGLVAGYAMGLKTTALFPKGLLQRGIDKIDHEHSSSEIRQQIETGAAYLLGTAPAVAKGSIRVVSKRHGGTMAESDEVIIDGDRRNPVLGNKSPLLNWKDKEARERVIRLHREHTYEPDVLNHGPIYRAMQNMAEQMNEGTNIALACWCAPLPCHCDHIAEGVRVLADGKDLQAKIKSDIEARQKPVRQLCLTP